MDAQAPRISSLFVIAAEVVAGRRRSITHSKDSCDVAKKHFPLLVEQQAAASPDLSPLDFGIWKLLEAKLRGNRASDMDTLKADISRAMTQLNSDAEAPTVVSVIHHFLPRLHCVQANSGSHCEGSVFHWPVHFFA